jgi:hypothetical protein
MRFGSRCVRPPASRLLTIDPVGLVIVDRDRSGLIADIRVSGPNIDMGHTGSPLMAVSIEMGNQLVRLV